MQLAQILPRRWRELPHELAKLGTLGASNILRVLPKRWQSLGHELAKFGTIGLINLLVNFAVFNLLWFTFLRNGELKAKAVATIVATTCAYFMNRHWTYRDRPKSTLRREYSLFIFFNAVGLVIEVAVVGIAKYGFDQTHIVVLNLCTGVGIVLGTAFRFWAYRTHVFKLGTADDLDTAAAPAAAPAADVPVAAGFEAVPVGVPVPDPARINPILLVRAEQPGTPDLQDELTQLELDGIVADEHAGIPSRS